MNLYFDLRTGNLVETPGLDTVLSALTFKAGDGEEVVLQFGRSPDTSTPGTVISGPSWTAENLPSGCLIDIGIKASGDYSDGDLLAGTSTYVADASAKTYTFTLDLNTTEINTALARVDADDTNDVAAIENALFEVTFKESAGAKYRTSKNDVTTTIKHDVLSGSEGTPSTAADPDEYALIANTIQHFPALTGLTGGTATDLDSIATVSRSAGEIVDLTVSGVLRVYELQAGTTAESSPDVIRPDDYATTTNEKVWVLLNTQTVTASGVTNTPAGNIAATDVQAAINELDTEKAAVSHTHAASDITSGTVATARLGSGTASSSTYLRGDQTWAAVSGGSVYKEIPFLYNYGNFSTGSSKSMTDSITTQAVEWGWMPRECDATENITLRAVFYTSVTAADDIVFQAKLESWDTGDVVGTPSEDSGTVSKTVTNSTTANTIVTTTDFNLGTPIPGKLFRLTFSRVGGDAGDTLSGTVNLQALVLSYKVSPTASNW